MKKAHNFRQLTIWSDSMELVSLVYGLTSQLPDVERFGLKAQIQRASVSIPSNIAEGSGRTTTREFIRFLEIAISSSYELETHLILIDMLYKIDTNNVLSDLGSVQRKIGAFTNKLKSEESIC